MWFLTFLWVCERILSTRPSEEQDLRWLMPAEEHVIHTLNTGRHSEQRFFMSTQVHTQKVKDSPWHHEVLRTTYLSDNDGWQVFEVLDVGQQWVSKCTVGLRWKLIERRLDLHLHCLSSKITGLYILFELQQLIWDLPCIHLQNRKWCHNNHWQLTNHKQAKIPFNYSCSDTIIRKVSDTAEK